MELGRYKGLVYLGLLLMVLPLAAWKLAIGQTWHIWRQTSRQTTELARLSSEMPAAEGGAATVGPTIQGDPGAAAGLPVTASSATSPTGASADTLEYIRSGLLIERLLPAMEAAGVAVVKYSPCITSSEGGLSVHTAELLLSGGFVPMVRVVDNLEKQLPGCKLVSVNFHSIRRQYNRPARLEASLVVQQIVFTK